MFETGIGREKWNEPVSLTFALFFFGICALAGLTGGCRIYWRRGLTDPWMLADMAVIFALSVYWIVNVLRNGPFQGRAFGWRMMALMLLEIVPFLVHEFHV
jgi:hypothetical protein